MSYPSLNLPRQGQAFTLIEVLVSMAVLTILGLLILQLTTATRNATRISNRGIDTAAEARLVFERLDLDLSALANRADVDFVVANPTTPGTAYSLLFISGVTSATASSPSPAPSPANNRGVSLIGYQVGTVPSGTVTVSQPCLLRAAKSVMWTDVSLLGIWRDATATGSLNTTLPLPLLNASPAPSPAATPAISLAATDFDVLSPAIIRMAVGFQLYPSGSAVTLADGSAIANAQGQIVYSPPVRLDANKQPTTYVDLSLVSALVVGVLAIDPDQVKNLTAAQTQSLAALFPTPATGELPVGDWTPIAANVSALPASVPLPARQSLRSFQRAFSINPYGSKYP